MSALTNGTSTTVTTYPADLSDPFKLARMAGYYKGIQSAGAAVSFGMDAVKVSPSHPFRLPGLTVRPPTSPSI